ncbi:MAG: cell division protein SepF [Lachnospiraceae bacterium]|nr:cell division protein SepF [Lachnospiraceae bacterium]MBQ2406413.1 cell division protein SepF [Lachnospiraceae bacterium]MEE0920438.1 cell division protein SepF [Lachnospiraceae bacterium]
MGLMDKFLNSMKLSDIEDEDFDDDYYDEGEIIDNTVRKPAPIMDDKEYNEPIDFKSKKNAASQKITPMRSAKKVPASGMEVCVIKPTSFDESREVADTLLANRAVVLNLEGIDVEIAQKILDFTSGTTYAIDGNLQRISNYIYIITPKSVEISGDLQDAVSGTFELPAMYR